MGNNSLQTTEKSLRSIAKRYENVKYSVGLAVLFLMKGTSAFSDENMILEAEKQKDILTDVKEAKEEVKETKKVVQVAPKLKASWVNMQFGANDMYSNFFATAKTKVDKTSIVKSEKSILVASSDNSTSLPMFAKLLSDIEETTENRAEVLTSIANKEETATPTMEEIRASKQELRSSVGNLQDKIDIARRENNKEINGLRLELIQLMEQGDQVVKSPWASWQFGANYMYSKWNGTYKGKGDKPEKYAFEGVFERGNWWENNVSPDSKAYSKLEISSSGKNSSLTNRRKNVDYGLVKTVPVVDKGVPFIIEPVININTPPLPNLNINPVTVNPNIGFNIPKVNTMSFEEITVNKIEPNVFEPPALNEVSTGFAQGQEIGLNTNQNYIVSNSTVNLVDSNVNIKIKDTGYEGSGKFSWDGHSDNRSRTNRPAVGGVHGTTDSTYSYIHTAGTPVVSEYSSNSNSPGLGFLDDSITRTDKKFPMNTNWRPVGDPNRREYGPSSQQVFLNVLTDGFNLDGAGKTLTFENHTTDPWSNTSNGLVRTNTVRVISVNHAYGSVNKTIDFNLNADLRIFGRDGYNDKMTTGNPKNSNPAPHMTVGIEHQAYGSVAARAINNGTMTLEKDSKKTGGLATYMVGMTAMVEDYGDYGHTLSPDDPNANVGIDPTWYLKDGDTDAAGVSGNKWKYRRQAPWESTLENRGTIKVNSIDSIGMDFAEYTFRADLAGTMYQSDNISGSTPNPKGKLPAYNNKGSLNIYARVGNIELNSEDPDGGVYSGIQGSYGLRVPNIFKTADNSQVYYDETVIDGSLNAGNPKGIVANGSHNVGVSISKLITGSDRVRRYHKGELGTQPVDGAKAYLVARPDTDPIGNIYNLNILVNGKENVGLLRKSDYMQGSKYDLGGFMPGLARSKNDFLITDSHVQSIDFSKDAKGGVLFRTDKYGIDLAKNNFTVTAMENQNKDASGNDMYNIAMLANGSVNSVVAGAPAEDNLDVNVPVKVKNTKPITIGSAANTGFNMVGLMAYKGGEFENKADITLNTKHSIALVVEGEGVRGANKKASSGTSTNSNIKVTGNNSIAVYNNGRNYTMNGGEINISGEKNVGVFAAGIPTYDHLGNITGYSNLATTTLNNGSLKVAGKGSVGLYANGGSDIKLDTMTNMLVKENSLLFYGIKHNTDYSQLELVGTNTATIEKGAYAFYFKNSNLLNQVVKPGSTGKLELTLQDGATLNIIEGDGTTPVLLSNIPTVTLNTGTDNEIVLGIVIKAASGNYITTKSTKVNLQMDVDSNLDDKNDRYLNSEFSSSSVTLMTGKTISGSGALTTADTSAEKVEKAKVAIAQSNVGSSRSAVKLTNNGTINFTGTGMAGIVGEYSEINNNSTINVTGANSTGIISANGSLATNNGTINIGNGGTGLAGINYLGVTATPASSIPTYGNQSIELVHNGKIVSTGNSEAIGVLASDLKSVVDKNGLTHNITNANAAKITLGNNSLIDVSSATGGVGVYSKGLLRNGVMANVIDNGSKIKLNTNGIGLYLEGTELTAAAAGSIESVNNTTAKGIYTDSNVNSAKNITLLGDKSIAIHNFGKNSQYGASNIDITNTGNITIGDSSDRNDPSIGIYTKYANVNHHGTIETGSKSLGIFSDTLLNLNLHSNGSIKVGNEGLGVYKKQGTADINGTIITGNSAAAVYADNNATINNNSTTVSVGDNSFGFIVLNNGNNIYNGSATSKFTMGSKSVYLYKTGANGTVNSATTVRSNGISSTAFYAKDGGKITNTGLVDFSNSVGSVGAYASAGEVYNSGNITVGASDIQNNYYAIGMATQNGGRVVNNLGATINVTGNYGIGMFAEGAGSRAENYGTIDIAGSGELKGAYGMYLNNGAYGLNQGTIRTGRYSNDSQKSASYGVAVLNGATLENRGTIDIDMKNSYGIYIKNGIIKNYGTINVSGAGSVGIRNKDGKDEHGNPITDTSLSAIPVNATNGASGHIDESGVGPQPAVAGSTNISPTGVVTINGKVVPIHDLTPGPNPIVDKNYAFSNVGIYVDTLGRTNPINWVDGFNPSTDNDLIIGAEAAELSTSKAIKIGRNIMSPYLREYQLVAATTRVNLNAISGSLTWTAQQIPGASGLPEEVIMAKIPYTDFVTKQENAWNFADGLEQRYGVEPVGSREKEVFNKLNSIGKNERVLLTQAYDEMMGHQYANTQQRVYTTGSILNTEFNYLRNEWRTASKDSNKIKTFGNKGEYKTDTAGVIDYKYNAYGVAYVHEDEDVKLGRDIGWYTGIVHNTFKFKDIGNSKEEQLQAKVGLLKSVPFDDNNSLNWTISGDIFAGYNKMHRKFLVVNEIFNAKSKYYTYGIGVKNELAKEFRLSESFTLRPYGSLRVEYGKISKIREKSGEIKLEVKNTDYISIKPELGIQLGFKEYFGRKLFTTTLGVAYENELGRIANVKNKGRVADTSADWFDIRGDKEDRRGNVKTDLTFGLDNTRVGVTANIGYDTKGENLRGGVGLRVIF